MSGRYHNNSSGTPTPTSGSQVEVGVADSRHGSSHGSGGVVADVGVADYRDRGRRSVPVMSLSGEGENGDVRGTTGARPVDRVLIQHLIHCESLLVVSSLCSLLLLLALITPHLLHMFLITAPPLPPAHWCHSICIRLVP